MTTVQPQVESDRLISINTPLQLVLQPFTSRVKLAIFTRSLAVVGPFSCRVKRLGIISRITVLGIEMGTPDEDPIIREIEPETYFQRYETALGEMEIEIGTIESKLKKTVQAAYCDGLSIIQLQVLKSILQEINELL